MFLSHKTQTTTKRQILVDSIFVGSPLACVGARRKEPATHAIKKAQTAPRNPPTHPHLDDNNTNGNNGAQSMQDAKRTAEDSIETANAPSTKDTKQNAPPESATALDERPGQAGHEEDGDDDDEYINICIRVPKANAAGLLKDMMSEYSEDACCARWGSDIDIEIDADARRRLAPGGNVARHSREMLNVALAQIHRHCAGWWSDRGPRADQEGWSLAFYPLDEWVALPVPYGMRESVAYPDAVVEERPSWWDSPDLSESDDFDWWRNGPDHDAAAGPTDRLDAVPESTAAADTPTPLQSAPGSAL